MEEAKKKSTRGFRFWMIILVLVISCLMAYLEAVRI